MTVRIFKYPIEVTDRQEVMMPEGSQVLDCQHQAGQGLQLWALVNDVLPLEPRTVFVVGTGHPADHLEFGKYVASVQDGPFVWHVFMA